MRENDISLGLESVLKGSCILLSAATGQYLWLEMSNPLEGMLRGPFCSLCNYIPQPSLCVRTSEKILCGFSSKVSGSWALPSD